MTAFLDITRHVEAVCLQAPALAAGDVVRSRLVKLAEDSQAGIRIFPQAADGKAAAVRGGFHSWQFEVAVECYARAPATGANAGDAEAEADALVAQVWARLAQATAPAGVQSVLNDPRLSFAVVEGETPMSLATLTFSVQVSTRNDTLAPWS